VHGIPAIVVDGNDVVEVARATAHFVERARTEGKPGMIEAVTYRWRGHVGYSEDLDVGVRRGSDLKLWKKRDPIARLAASLREAGTLSADGLNAIHKRAEEAVLAALADARNAPYPPEALLMDAVYAKGVRQ
jgi:pyruvate dehydrogenase E1 component alpha subunit